MANVRRCYNESCKCNVDGAYCDTTEIVVGDGGVCETYYPKSEEQDDDN